VRAKPAARARHRIKTTVAYRGGFPKPKAGRAWAMPHLIKKNILNACIAGIGNIDRDRERKKIQFAESHVKRLFRKKRSFSEAWAKVSSYEKFAVQTYREHERIRLWLIYKGYRTDANELMAKVFIDVDSAAIIFPYLAGEKSFQLQGEPSPELQQP
jgi:hypothetical protein